jgi:hypothetical protein
MHPVALRVSVSPKTTIFVLQASGRDPDYTQAFLQACMEEYIALKREMRMQTSDTTVAGLTEEVMRLEKDLRKAEEELAEFQTTNSVVFFREEANSAGNYLDALNQRLAAQKSEYELLQMLTLDQSLDRQREMGGALPVANAPPLDQSSTPRQDANGTLPTASGSNGHGLPQGQTVVALDEGRSGGDEPVPEAQASEGNRDERRDRPARRAAEDFSHSGRGTVAGQEGDAGLGDPGA